MATKENARLKRKQSIRKRISGSVERPRMSVYRSMQHIYVQVIDDSVDAKSNTLLASSTLDPALTESLKGMKKREQAKQVGKKIAELCLAKGIDKVVFDRNGFIYHGRVSALAEGAREGGLKF
ncbi:MAG: 50S ribosomal protein L18 [Myxococcales bacterium]|jgi:large subunit ribosomal protein L18|nr:50S ribosomal protein L18 [Myxococcales bacterium]